MPWVLHGVPEGLRETILAKAPAAQRVIWLLTRRSFGRRERLAFRYA